MRNIKIAYVLSFISEFYFPVSIWLFYFLNYLNFTEIGILTAVKIISSNIFEIPTGVFADFFGRKRSLTLAFLIYALVMFGFANVSAFWMFLVLDILKSLSNAFYSGSLEALVYDTLKEKNEESKYDKVVSNIESLQWIGLFISSIAGGYFYYLNIHLPYIIQGTVCLFAFIFTFFLIEPKLASQKSQLKTILHSNLKGFKELFKNFEISKLSIIFITVGSGYLIASEFLGISQAREYGMDSRAVGIMFAIGFVISAIASQIYPKLKTKFGDKNLILFSATFLIASFLFAKWVGLIVGAMLIIGRISSSPIFRNTRSSMINKRIASGTRATTLSTLNLLTQLPLALIAYFMGVYIDNNSANDFAFIVGVGIIILLAVQFLIFKLIENIRITSKIKNDL
ncbi:MFS transporter [Candidatus Dojkabacteria bacterium]|nr:MFS transporter [Candidatus Dojkabacteria bacterium]